MCVNLARCQVHNRMKGNPMTTQLLKVILAAQVTGDNVRETITRGIQEKEGYVRDLLFEAGMTSDQWEHARHATKWRIYYEGEDEAFIIAYNI